MKDSRRSTTKELIEDVNAKSGKPGGWPSCFAYDIRDTTIRICADHRKLDKRTTRRLDPWGLAFLVEAESRCGIKVDSIDFSLDGGRLDGILAPDLEAFRRRVSFLSINNKHLLFNIAANGEPLELDDAEKLFSRPENEIVREDFVRRQDNRPGRLEKDFQTWLFANDVKSTQKRDANTNVRLAVLGEDFFSLGKRNLGIIREFPTGVFDSSISSQPSNKSRILPTEFVDIVTLNKYGQLAVVELKLNDSQLEVLAQLLDYSLFFRCYRDRLSPIIVRKLGGTPTSNGIACYVVNNHFHDRFDKVMSFYGPNSGAHGFRLVKTLLGHYSEMGTAQGSLA